MSIEKLKPYTFNAKKWRIRNGYDTPEWQMYVNNVIFHTTIIGVSCFIFGVIMATWAVK